MNAEILAQELVKEFEKSGYFERIFRKVFSEQNQNRQTSNSPEKTSLSYSLRGDCLALSNRIQEKYGIESKVIFGQLKKLTGTSQPEASEKQLSERVEILQRWLQTGVLE